MNGLCRQRRSFLAYSITQHGSIAMEQAIALLIVAVALGIAAVSVAQIHVQRQALLNESLVEQAILNVAESVQARPTGAAEEEVQLPQWLTDRIGSAALQVDQSYDDERELQRVAIVIRWSENQIPKSRRLVFWLAIDPREPA